MIIVRLSGGMGNQMFQYVLGRVLSLKNATGLVLDTTFLKNQAAIPFIRTRFTKREYALGVFQIEASIASQRDIPWYGRPFFSGFVMQCIDAVLRKIPVLPGWEKCFGFDENILKLGPDAYLAGFWQSEKYFAEYKETILSDFKLKTPLDNANAALHAEIKSQVSVAMHVRRADFAQSDFHGVQGVSYYTQGLAYILDNTQVDKVYVFSDDIAWAKKHLQLDIDTIFVDEKYTGGKHGEQHLQLMRACTHFIIPNSTFSWWAAWLGEYPNKIVVVPKRWFGTQNIDTSDLIPESWIQI